MNISNENIKEAKYITTKSKTNFLYSFSLLPKEKNEAINTVYAFCRYTDDIVDNDDETKEIRFGKIREWRNEFEKALGGNSAYPMLNQLNKVIKKFNILSYDGIVIKHLFLILVAIVIFVFNL